MADYVGLAIKPYNDLELTADGNLRLVYDAEAIGQHARQRLSLFLGEWFLDAESGVDWFGQVMGARQDRLAIGEAMVKATILATPGVSEIEEISTRYDRTSRGMIVEKCVVRTVFDETVEV